MYQPVWHATRPYSLHRTLPVGPKFDQACIFPLSSSTSLPSQVSITHKYLLPQTLCLICFWRSLPATDDLQEYVKYKTNQRQTKKEQDNSKDRVINYLIKANMQIFLLSSIHRLQTGSTFSRSQSEIGNQWKPCVQRKDKNSSS